MMNRSEYDLVGRVLEADGKIRGYTFGAPVSRETFCVFLEIADKSTAGVPQLMFRELCREMQSYPRINAMGDCGFVGLKRAKEAYRPANFARVYTARKLE